MSINVNTGPATTSSPGTSSQPIDYLGALSGLLPTTFNPNTIINSLIAVQQIPVQNLQTQINTINTTQNSFTAIAADVASLQTNAFTMTLQSTIQANAATSSNPIAVSVSASPLAQAGNYSIAVNTLATATTATSTGGVGLAIDTQAATTPLNQLNLSAAPTAGAFSVVVDGTVQTLNVDPTKALQDPAGALSLLQSALASSLSGDAGAALTVGVSNNKVTIGITGATTSHTISFGASGDTSNFLSVMNLATANGITTSGGVLNLASSGPVGVTQTSATLGSAGLATSLTAGSGAFSINGVSIAWNSVTDSINSVINNINNSNAGVNAQYNTVTDKLTLTSKNTGQAAITMQDTSGNLLAALNLAPGTTNAQQLGSNANLTINGTTVTSPSNKVTNAAPGLTITATALTPSGTPATVNVASDTTGITKSVQAFVTAANKVLSDISTTQQKDLTTGTYSKLLGDSTLTGLQSKIINMITGRLTNSGKYQSLQDVGITTGAVGSLPGTTLSLSLDTTKLTAALSANPAQVAALFNGTTAQNGFQGAAQQLNTYLKQQTNPVHGSFALQQTASSAQIKTIQSRMTQIQAQIAIQRQVLVAKFSAMSKILGNLSAESTALASVGIGTASSTSSSSSSSSG